MNYDQLIEHYGSQTNAAKALGISPVAVCLWQKGGIPERRQLQLQQLTRGALKADAAVLRAYRALLPEKAA